MSKAVETLGNLKVLHQQILIQFVEEVKDGVFKQTTASGIVIVEDAEKQVETPRWAKAIAVGNKVEEISKGDYVYIQPLRWTNGMVYAREKFWLSDEKEVIAVSKTKPEQS